MDVDKLVVVAALLLVLMVRADPGTVVPTGSLMQYYYVTGYSYNQASGIVPGFLVSSVCSSAGLVPVDAAPASMTPILSNIFYPSTIDNPLSYWVSGLCVAFFNGQVVPAPCTASFLVLCSSPPGTIFPTATVTPTATSFAPTITFTDTFSQTLLSTSTSVLTVYTSEFDPSTTVSTVRTTLSTGTTVTSTVESVTVTIVSTIATISTTQTDLSLSTNPFTVTRVTVTVTTVTVTSLTEDIRTSLVVSTATLESCPTLTTTVSTDTETTTLTSITGTSRTSARTTTRTRTRTTTTGTCSFATRTTVAQTSTTVTAIVSTVTVLVPPPPCPPVSPCDRIEGCFACPYEFPCGLLDGPVAQCALRVEGIVAVVNAVHRQNVTCVCRELGLEPAAIDGSNQQAALDVMQTCLGAFRYAWIGSWNGVAAEDGCLALFTNELGAPGGVGIPQECGIGLPVLCAEPFA